jgi:hypothetical protein
MEIPSMFMDWKNEYCENGHVAENNIHIECISHPKFCEFYSQNSQIANAIPSKKSNATGLELLLCNYTTELYLQKQAWHWHKNRYVHQRKRIEDPKISPCSYSHLTLNKGAKNMLENRQTLQQIVLGKLNIHM